MDRPSSLMKFGGGLLAFLLGWLGFGWGFLGFILVGGDHGDFGAALPVLDLCKSETTRVFERRTRIPVSL